MANKLKVLQYGIGPIGQKAIKAILNRKGLELLGAYDIDPSKVGKDVGTVIGEANIGIKISNNLQELLPKADIVLVTTASSLKKVFLQIEELVKAGKPVISSCEELMYSWETDPEISEKIDHLAQKNKVAVLSTGINPGFIMDTLPLVLTSVCLDVKKIRIERHQDASIRRLPFQKKIGAGATLQEFEERMRDGSLRHVGLTESIHMIAEKLNWRLEKVTDNIQPIIAEREVKSEFITVKKGNLSGIKQIGIGIREGEAVITLDMLMCLGYEKPHDSIMIEGNPNIYSNIEGGINGDIATVAVMVNSIPEVLKAKPGLRTMSDISITSYYRAFND